MGGQAKEGAGGSGGEMSVDPIFNGTVKSGAVVMDPNTRKAHAIYLCGMEGKAVEVVIRRKRKKRSNNQNAYVWGVAYEILSNFTGYSPEEVHDMCKWMFLKKRNEGMPDTVRSTTELTTVEFSEYVDNIVRWANEKMDVYIPLPGECDWQ
jgi:hypothetical protein